MLIAVESWDKDITKGNKYPFLGFHSKLNQLLTIDNSGETKIYPCLFFIFGSYRCVTHKGGDGLLTDDYYELIPYSTSEVQVKFSIAGSAHYPIHYFDAENVMRIIKLTTLCS